MKKEYLYVVKRFFKLIRKETKMNNIMHLNLCYIYIPLVITFFCFLIKSF